MILKLERASESLGELVKVPFSGAQTQGIELLIWVGNLPFFNRFPGVLALLLIM